MRRRLVHRASGSERRAEVQLSGETHVLSISPDARGNVVVVAVVALPQ